MTNEHAIWAAYFLPSIFVWWCVLLLSFVASQRRQVYLCACRTSADRCTICVMLLPTFSQMCPCSLLASAHITLGGACWIRPQHRHAMSNTPFQGLIWLHFFSGYAPFLSLSPFVVLHFCFWLISISFLPGVPALLLLPPSPVNFLHPLVWCILSVTYCVSLALFLVFLSIRVVFYRCII